MSHQRWWCTVIWRHGCPACKVRQLRYGFRLDPMGYRAEIRGIRLNKTWTQAQRRWILEQVGQW